MTKNNYVIYCLLNPLTNNPVYVGQSQDYLSRYSAHLWNIHDTRNKSKLYKNLRKIYKESQLVPPVKLLEKTSKLKVLKREEHWINKYRKEGFALYNRPNKLKESQKANEHLLIRKRAKKAIFRIVKGGNTKGVADLIEVMINEYLEAHFPEDTATYQESYIKDV